jgi:hypothetical protein
VGYRLTLRTSNLNVSYAPASGAPIHIKGVDITLDYDRGATLLLKARAASPVAAFDVRASDLTKPNGDLNTAGAQIDLSASATLPGALVDSLIAALIPGSASAHSPGAAPTPETRFAGAAQMRAGRLTLTSPASPIILQTPLPGPVISLLNTGDSPASITQAPVYTIAAQTIDFPIAAGPSGFDFRGASFALTIKSTEARGQFQFAQGESPRALVISPWETNLNIKDFATGLQATGAASVLVDGAPAGAIRLNAQTAGLLDDQGRLSVATPKGVRAELRLEQAPVGLLEPIVAGRDLSLTEVLGPTLTGLLAVQSKEFKVAAPGQKPEPAEPGSFEFTAEAKSSHMSLWTVLVTDGQRLWSEGRAARIELDHPGPALQALLAERGVPATGAGLVISEIHDLDLPLVNFAPDLSRANASVRFAVGDITVTPTPAARPVEIVSLQTNLDVAPGPRFGVAIDYRLKTDALTTTANGRLDIVDLAERSTGGPPWVQFTPQRARPVGVIQLAGLPSDALGLLPAPWNSAARDALGPALAGNLEFTADENSRDIGVSLALTGDGAVAKGRFVLDDLALRSVGEGLTLELKTPGPLARAALASTPGAEVLWESPLRASVRDLTIPRSGELSHTAAVARIELTNASIRFSPDDPWVKISSLSLDASLAQGGEAKLAIDGVGAYEDDQFQAKGAFTFAGLPATAADLDLSALRPQGALNLTGVPGALARLAPGDVGVIANEALGERFDLSISSPAPPASLASLAGKDGASLRIDLKGQSLTGATDIRFLGRDLWIGPTGADLNATPALVTAIGRLAQSESALPTLERAARIRVDVQPLAISRADDGSFDPRTLRPIMVMASSPDEVVLGNLPIGPEGTPRMVGLRKLTVGAAYHRNDMVASEGSIRATIFDPADPAPSIAEVDIVSGLILPRPPAITASVARVDTARLDRLLARPGITSDALGAEAGVSILAAPTGPGQPLAYRFTLRSNKLNADGALIELRDRIQLASPVALTWEAPASWLNANILPAPPEGSTQQELAVTDPVTLTAELRALTFGKPGAFTPGVFTIDARASAPSVRLMSRDKERIAVDGIQFTLAPGDAPNQLRFSITTERQTSQTPGQAAPTPLDPVRASGVISNYADSQGAFDAESATITATIVGAVSTSRVDAIADAGGLFVDLLGAVTNVNVQTKALSRSGGSLQAQARTANADADIEGAIEDGQFVASAPGRITLRRVTPELSARVFETVIPIVTRVEKTAQDRPATVDATELTIPLDNDMSNFNGRVRVDLGTVQFQTSDIFGQLLKATGNRAQGSIGKSVKPFEFVIANGVIAYDRVELPVGEFTFVTSGSVDLVNKSMDITTFVPVLVIADEVVKVTKFAPGLAMIPIRTKGKFGQAKSEIALDQLLNEGLPGAAVGGVEGLIGGIGSAIEEALSKKKEDDKKKQEKKKQKKAAKKAAEQNSKP